MTSDEKPGSSILDATNDTSSLPARLAPLAETARDYARAATSTNTNRAYAADWRHYSAWTRRQNLPALPPDPQVLGLYIAACASGAAGPQPCSVSTIERRLSALMWNFAQRGQPMDRKDRHVATVLAGIRRTQGRPPEQKEAVLPEHLLAMIATLDLGDLRGLRDRAILLIGFAGGLRRSEIVGLDCRAEDGLSGRLDRIFRRRPAADAAGKDRLAGGRDRPRLLGRHLPGRRPRNLAQVCADFCRAAVPAGGWRKSRPRPPDRQARRPAGQTYRARGRRARRPQRGRAGEEILGPFAARRPRLLRRGRRTLCAKAARPRFRRNDPPLSAPPRPLPRQSHQGGGPLNRCSVSALPCAR